MDNKPKDQANKTEILEVKIDLISMKEVVEKVTAFINGEKKYYVVTPNPEIIIYAQKDFQFKKILNQAEIAIPDGTGVVWAVNKIKNQKSRLRSAMQNYDGQAKIKDNLQRLTGIDLMLKLCELAPRYGWRIGLIGGYDETAGKTAEVLRKKYPRINIVFAENGGEIGLKGESNSPVILASPARSGAKNLPEVDPSVASLPQDDKINNNLDLLFVAFGFPKQEYWIAKNIAGFPAKVFIPVGGAFDYISGKVKRAPVWMQKIGLEWLYRLICEPWRVKRQLAGAKFFFLVIIERYCSLFCLSLPTGRQAKK